MSNIHYIQLTPSVKIPKGNFASLYDISGNEELYLRCLQAEQLSREHFDNCLNTLRSAIELTAFDLETKYRMSRPGNTKSWQQTWDEVRAEEAVSYRAEPGTRRYNCKAILADQVDRCRNAGRPLNDRELLDGYRAFLKKHKSSKTYFAVLQRYEEGRKYGLVPFLYDLYSFLSMASHSGGQTTGQECIGLLQLFYEMLRALYGLKDSYRPELCPIGPYFPIPHALYPRLELAAGDASDLYAAERNGTVEYFLLKRASTALSHAEKRELIALERLWKRSMKSPNNVLYLRETVGRQPYTRQVFALPTRPKALSPELLSRLNQTQKDELATGVLSAVASLHSMTPPLIHRGLNPDSFYVCATAQGLKPLLVNFETVKDFSVGASFTVRVNVENLLHDRIKAAFLAPEVLESDAAKLPKADIYSLGKLLNYIYTGKPVLADPPVEGLSEDKLELFRRMTAKKPEDRPAIGQILLEFSEYGVTKPSYAVFSAKGLREDNQDAFYCSEEPETFGDNLFLSGSAQLPLVLAVFDGMGGGEEGQALAQLAAQTAQKFCDGLRGYELEDYTDPLLQLSGALQEAVEAYQQQMKLGMSGTTMAAAVLTRDAVHFINLGDSKIFRVRGQRVEQLSKDHCVLLPGGGHGPLTQYVGKPHRKNPLQPHTGRTDCAPGDYILLCSDGFSSAVSQDELAEILNVPGPLEDKALSLAVRAEENGCEDNVTVVLYTREGR